MQHKHTIGASLIIAGTAIGAGMLAIPLVTAQYGVLPTVLITCFAWAVMYLSGLFVMEGVLWSEENANFLTMSEKFLGRFGKGLTFVFYLFLYGCLLVAYFSGIEPILRALFGSIEMATLMTVLVVTLGLIIIFGMLWIDRLNLILMIGLSVAFLSLLALASEQVSMKNLDFYQFQKVYLALPLLFAAFGYHNVIPSICTYLKRDVRKIKIAIFIGTFLTLIIYLLWQFVILASVEKSALLFLKDQGLPVTFALQNVTKSPLLGKFALGFSFFALTTSLLGVAFSMVDFLIDGFKMKMQGIGRMGMTIIVLILPLSFARFFPNIFVEALEYAGGFGEAYLNALLPALVFFVAKKRRHLQAQMQWKADGLWLFIVCLVALLTIVLQAFVK
ncbi:MAG: Tyrosine-specific transport protein [Chlamydiae bacterium]|nr:Tyrosine-specific transport protein [Chlamydiota bacterium]